jgi:hypothetical protein
MLSRHEYRVPWEKYQGAIGLCQQWADVKALKIRVMQYDLDLRREGRSEGFQVVRLNPLPSSC